MIEIDANFIRKSRDAFLAARQRAFDSALCALGVESAQREDIVPSLTMDHLLLVPPGYCGLPALRGQTFVKEHHDRYVNTVFVVLLAPQGLELLKVYRPGETPE